MNSDAITSIARAVVRCALIVGIFGTVTACDMRYHETVRACIKSGGSWEARGDFNGNCRAPTVVGKGDTQ